MRFLVGLAAAVWTAKQVPLVGWVVLAVVGLTLFLFAWSALAMLEGLVP